MAVIEAGDADFAQVVLESPLPVIVDFWADWCAPCKQLAPVFAELSERYGDRMRFVKVDTNANARTAADAAVLSLPTIQVYSGGRLEHQAQGGQTKAALVKLIERFV